MIWKRGGFFERVRKVQTTLTRIFIVLESVSHGLSENWDEISRKAQKFKGFFRPKSGGLQKKRSSPKLRLIFRPNSEILKLEGGLFSYGGAIFKFSQKIGLKSTKNVRFCVLHKPMGGGSSPLRLPLATLLHGCNTIYITVSKMLAVWVALLNTVLWIEIAVKCLHISGHG